METCKLFLWILEQKPARCSWIVPTVQFPVVWKFNCWDTIDETRPNLHLHTVLPTHKTGETQYRGCPHTAEYHLSYGSGHRRGEEEGVVYPQKRQKTRGTTQSRFWKRSGLWHCYQNLVALRSIPFLTSQIALKNNFMCQGVLMSVHGWKRLPRWITEK